MPLGKVLVTGGTGFLGRAVVCELRRAGFARDQIVAVGSDNADLRNRHETTGLFEEHRPALAIHLAAKCGGILANMASPYEFASENLSMAVNVVDACVLFGCKLVTVASVCGYPRDCPVPFREEEFWCGEPESTNAPYGNAKRALVSLVDAAWRDGLAAAVLVPTNLYGPGDHFGLKKSHVIPALIRRMNEAADEGRDEVVVMGTGGATRDFLYVDDAAAGIVRAAIVVNHPAIINLGSGVETAISDVAELIAAAVEFKGRIVYDASRPDGQPRRLLDITRARSLLDWSPSVSLVDGIMRTTDWWLGAKA